MTDDRESDSSDYLDELIKKPENYLIKDQVSTSSVTMVVIYYDEIQKLYTFEVNDDDTTVKDLIDMITRAPLQDMTIYRLTDPNSKYNFVLQLHQECEANLEENGCDLNIESFRTIHNSPSNISWSNLPKTNEELENLKLKQTELRSSEIEKNSNENWTEVGNSSKESERFIAISPANEKQKRNNEPVKRMEQEIKSLLLNLDSKAGSKMTENYVNRRIELYKEQDMDCTVNVRLPYTDLYCRVIIIGTYAYIPKETIIISRSGLYLRVPLPKNDSYIVHVELKFKDIVKVLYNFQESIPVLFFYATTNAATEIGELLEIQQQNDDKSKRIILVLDNLSEESENILKTLFSKHDLLGEFDGDSVESYLQYLMPEDIWRDTERVIKELKKARSANITSASKLVSPMENSAESKFSDATVMNERNKKHVKTPIALTNRSKKFTESKELDEDSDHSVSVLGKNKEIETLVEKPRKLKRSRERVEKVENFVNEEAEIILVYPPPPARGGITVTSQDYACLRENRFLNDVIIDFYLKYLTLQVLSHEDRARTHVFSIHFYKRLTSSNPPLMTSGTPFSLAEKRHANVRKWTKNVNIFDKDFIIVPINESSHWYLAIICFPGLVGSTRVSETFSGTYDISQTIYKHRKAKKMRLETVTSSNKNGFKKLPCILIFDSLPGRVENAKEVMATLRDYLTYEHLAEFGTEIFFTEDTIKGDCPKVPKQYNFTDCGLYVLQYVENFFSNPVKDYTLPIVTLADWFDDTVIIRKRRQLSKLIRELIKRQAICQTASLE